MIQKRTRAREVALQLLFERDLHKGEARREDVARFARQELGEGELEKYALVLFDGAVRRLPEIDEGLARAAVNWSLTRMAGVDRNILRLGAYELFHSADAPEDVVMDEVVELAKKFGSADSPGFINGVLDQYKRERKAAGAPAEPAPAEAAPAEGA